VIVVPTDGSKLVVVQRTDLDLNDKKARQLAVADNRAAELGLDWDPAILSDFSVDDLQPFFTFDELKELVPEAQEAESVPPGDEEEVPIAPVIPVSVPGDIWILGEHRLMCGDSTNIDAVERLMNGTKADMVFTDPPYNVGYDPESRKSSFSAERLSTGRLGEIKNDKQPAEEFRRFLDDVYTSIDMSLKPGRAIYICHADTEGHHFRNAFLAQPWKLQSCLIWKKSVLVFGRADYHWQHEPILYGWKEGAPHVWVGDRKQTTILEFATDHYTKNESDTGGKYVHPTQKPVPLIVQAFENSSSSGELVLDLFGGSGSTLIACEKKARKARLMELDPRYVDVIVKRWQQYTGKQARHEDGSLFDDRLSKQEAA
jgi:DNA modification methylase